MPFASIIVVDVSGRAEMAQRSGGKGARGNGTAAARTGENEEAFAIRGHPGTGYSQDAAAEC